jgi:hypothetical protein
LKEEGVRPQTILSEFEKRIEVPGMKIVASGVPTR